MSFVTVSVCVKGSYFCGSKSLRATVWAEMLVFDDCFAQFAIYCRSGANALKTAGSRGFSESLWRQL